jgi:YesN/AraC family two-component response regulator
MSNIKELISFSKPLSILYVEDDIAIRDNYAKVFKEVFGSVELARDGKDGWGKYQSALYDLVITDINMPVMNGIEMIKLIVEKNPQQIITVTSAHDEAQYLLQLIDLGVEKFLIKPIDFQKLITVLLSICKRLTEQKEYHEYQEQIEKENLHTAELLKELKKKNDLLEKVVHKLNRNENVNIALLEGIGKAKEFTARELKFYTPKIQTQSAQEFVDTFIGDLDTFNDRLAYIEESFELVIHQKLIEPTPQNIEEVSKVFCDYSYNIRSLHKFSNLSEALSNFGTTLRQIHDPSLLKEMKGFLFGIAHSLHTWRHAILVNKTAEDIHFLDNSIISDCMQTESMLVGSFDENSDKDDVDGLFFDPA